MSISSLPRTVGRTGLAATAAAFLAFGLAAPAAADPDASPTQAAYNYNAARGVTVTMSGEENSGTSLFDLDLAEGGTLKTYCIDLKTEIPRDLETVPYVEGNWADYPGKGDFEAESGKVLWVLQNSYPTQSDLGALGGLAGVEGLTEGQAIAATQAAIWRFSNGSSLENVPSGNQDRDGTHNNKRNVTALYDYLVGAAEPVSEPAPALSITPGEVSGNAGEIVGEFTVQTNAAELQVMEAEENPEGVELVYAENGELVETVKDGDVVGFLVPEDAEAGQAGFSLSASTTFFAGRLFQGDGLETQTLITAEDDEVTVSASAVASWTEGGETPPESPEPSEPESPEPSEPENPEPTPSDEPSEPVDKPSEPADDQNEPTLPVTGGALAGLVAAGVAALGAGGGAIYLSRKRKAAGSQDLEG
ncbi:thioester domain-containing protein [Nocardiopsis sp. RV163]|uniref:thioester domain-containing protein n=1 Tax=Nocardiopsis sp. RV163 TaxID=1661388 RepID=UPI00064BA035|nr:thioester domain-containing protein [Nocardiopsis sp. RV163]